MFLSEGVVWPVFAISLGVEVACGALATGLSHVEASLGYMLSAHSVSVSALVMGRASHCICPGSCSCVAGENFVLADMVGALASWSCRVVASTVGASRGSVGVHSVIGSLVGPAKETMVGCGHTVSVVSTPVNRWFRWVSGVIPSPGSTEVAVNCPFSPDSGLTIAFLTATMVSFHTSMATTSVGPTGCVIFFCVGGEFHAKECRVRLFDL